MTTVAIHQPNYLPWMGFFHKLRHCDVFIVLDDVQLPRNNKGSWVNRSKVLVEGEPRWLTVPICRPSGLQLINQVVQADASWKVSHRERIHHWYRLAPFYTLLSDFLDELFSVGTSYVYEFNLRTIGMILEVMGSSDLDKLVMASSFSVQSSSTLRLVELVQKTGGSRYLCGSGAEGYFDDSVIAQAGIEFHIQHFLEHPRPQLGEKGFCGGLSIIDSLLMIGPEETNKALSN